MDEIMVSVICLAYNHEAWIRDALEGFVRQQAPFRFEVLVHDDASTDGTAAVIREYQERYPQLIRPVYQTENQYSKGFSPALAFLAPLIRGRYVAFCEGDDWWCDPHKLEKQVAALERTPGADICAHRTMVWKCGDAPGAGRRRGYVAPRLRRGMLSTEDVIVGGGSRYVATSSLMCRREAYLEMTPMRKVMINDYVLQLQCSARGGMGYLSDCMSVYRTGVPGSWNKRIKGRRGEVRRKTVEMLGVFDDFTGGRFHAAVERRLALYASDDLLHGGRLLAMLSPRQMPATILQLRRTFRKALRRIYFHFKQ